jgi:hypothetical protein
MRTGLARLDPPLRLTDPSPGVQPAPSLLGRLLAWTRPSRHTDARSAGGPAVVPARD